MVDLIITSLETITGFALGTGNHLFTLDELQNASLAQGQEKVDITGKAGRKLSSMKRNKTFTVSGANGMLSAGLLELQTGGKFVNSVTSVQWTDYLTVDNDKKAKTAYKAIGTAGAEIDELYIIGTEAFAQRSLEQDATAAAGKFAYDPETKELTFGDDVDAGTEIAVYYKRKIAADVLRNESDVYSGKAELYIDCLAEDKCAHIYHVQIHVPKADFNGEFNIDLGGDQVVHNFEAEGLAGACGAGGKLWDMIIFGVDTEDAEDENATPVITKTLASIAITTAPTKVAYAVGESFVADGMVVTATYSDDSTDVLAANAYTYAPDGELSAEDTEITVSYTEGGVTKTATQAITVS